MHCIDITIEVDGAVENSEMFSVMLSTTEERVNLFPALANITIIDNDSKLCRSQGPFHYYAFFGADVTIGFAEGAMIRFVNESSSQIEECVVLSHFNLQRELTVTIVTEEESATVEDFNPLHAFSVVFTPETGIRECFAVNIVDDDILENTEVFHLSILPTNDSAIVLQNTVLSVGIENDDSKLNPICPENLLTDWLHVPADVSVHFEQTELSVNEEGMLEVCVGLTGNIELNVSLMLSAGEISDLPESTRAQCE